MSTLKPQVGFYFEIPFEPDPDCPFDFKEKIIFQVPADKDGVIIQYTEYVDADRAGFVGYTKKEFRFPLHPILMFAEKYNELALKKVRHQPA